MSFVRGSPVMVDGVVVGTGGTLLCTDAGAAHAAKMGLQYQIVDPRDGLTYSRT